MESKEEQKFMNLKIFNLFMGVIHLIQGFLMLILSNDFTLPVTRGFLEFNEVTKSLEPTAITIFDLRIGPIVASFLFMSAIAHFLIATVLYKNYVSDLKKGINRYRWYEYSISASVMIVVIAMLTGIYDVGTLLLIFFMNAMMIIFGLRMEVHNQNKEKLDWKPFYYGCLAGLLPWVVIAIHLLGTGADGGGPPDFVYYIYVSIAIFFNSFAINMVLQYKKAPSGKLRQI